LVLPLKAGEIIDGDPADGTVDTNGTVNNTSYAPVYDNLAGNPPASGGACDVIEAFPLPFLGPNQTVSAASISFYLDGQSIQTSIPFNLQLYGLKRVLVSSSAPLPATAPLASDYYASTNDTANTLLDATFIPSTATPNQAYTYSGSNLVSFINTQYANTAFSGLSLSNNRFIFFRLSPNMLTANGQNYDLIASSRNPNRAIHPLLSLTVSGGITNTNGCVQFSFNLPSNSTGSYDTSAGVYNTATGALIRTLWNNVQYQAGLNYGVWDGNDDSGNPLAKGTNYQIKLIYHNVQYIWQGMVGNTSTATSGGNVYHSFDLIHDMSFTGNATAATGYYTLSYNENGAVFHSFPMGSPQVPSGLNFQNYGNNYADPSSAIYYVAADAAKTYWAKVYGGAGGTNTYVFAINNSTTQSPQNTFYTFPKGTVPPSGPGQYPSCADFDNTANQANPATGIAVQQGATGDLFVSHGNLNVVRVFDKVQGNLLGSFTVQNPGRLAVAPNGDVWVTSRGTTPEVLRYTFTYNSTTGKGTATLDQTLTGFNSPAGVGVSPDGTLVLVADGGTSQQVMAFTNSTGVVAGSATPVWTYGTPGGMAANGPLATGNNSFDFNVEFPNANSFSNEAFIAFQPDGTFWLEDGGNSRVLHFSIGANGPQYIEDIAFTSACYRTAVDTSNPTRVFNQFLEYSVNYSQPLGGTNGSWSLVNNWAVGLPNDSTHLYYGVANGWLNVVTLSNGRTYGLLNNFNNNNSWDLFELPASGPARFTGYQFTNNPLIYPDGSLRFNITNSGETTIGYYSAPLTGFDTSNNPIWGSPATLATTSLTSANPIPWNTYPLRTEFTAGGSVIDFGANQANTGYHLGGIALGGTTWNWQASPSSNDTVWFPQDGHFDLGHGVQYAGNYAEALGRNIIYGYHGELWGGGEASQWVNYLDNGLMVGRFGTYGTINTLNGATNGFAGNSFAWTLVNGPDGNVYLYHNDEANHGGTVRWMISGWDAISELDGTSTIGSTVSLSGATSGPTVLITSPLNGAINSNGSSLTLSAQAAGTGAGIASVQFMDGATSLGTVTLAPFTLNYSGLSAGSHVITAIATDTNGLSTTSAPVTVSISGDGTSAPPPAPTSLSTGTVAAQSVVLNWTEPAVGTTSSTIGNIISFQSDVAGDSNALAPTAVAGASPYAVANFNLLGQTTGTAIVQNVVNSAGTTITNLGINAGITPSNSTNSTESLTGTAAKLFSTEVQTHSSNLAFSNVPYANYDLVVYSLPGNIFGGTQTASVTVTEGANSSTVQQTFTTGPTGYTVSDVPLGTNSSVTNVDTVVIQGLTTPFFVLQGGNIAGYQIVERPLDQGVPASYNIQRAVGTNGTFVTVGTASGSALTFTDTDSLSPSTTYAYRIQAVNGSGSSAYSNTVTITTPAPTTTSFATWQQQNFTADQLNDAAISGPTADPYGSGVPNLLAYALQLNPATAKPTDVPSPVISNGHLSVTYFDPTAITDVTYIVEVSTDLQTWNSGPGYTAVVTTVPGVGGNTITVQDTLPATNLKHFMRLRVTQN
jgi:hypothetical protein